MEEFALTEEPVPAGGTLRVAPCLLRPSSDPLGAPLAIRSLKEYLAPRKDPLQCVTGREKRLVRLTDRKGHEPSVPRHESSVRPLLRFFEAAPPGLDVACERHLRDDLRDRHAKRPVPAPSVQPERQAVARESLRILRIRPNRRIPRAPQSHPVLRRPVPRSTPRVGYLRYRRRRSERPQPERALQSDARDQ